MKDTLVTSAIMVLIFATTMVTIPLVFSDDGDEWSEYRQRSIGVAAISNPVYRQECGDCHMAYPPGLLPSRSWERIMAGLEDHFGDNAELEAVVHREISEFLFNNSADKSSYRRSRKINSSIGGNEVPVRISQTPYFKHEHDEIPASMVKDNDAVKSFSNCNACHSGAEKGLFDEDSIRIPGYGRWDD